MTETKQNEPTIELDHEEFKKALNNAPSIAQGVYLLGMIIVIPAVSFGIYDFFSNDQRSGWLLFSLFVCVWVQIGMTFEASNRAVLTTENSKNAELMFNADKIKSSLVTQLIRMSYFLLLWPRFWWLLRNDHFKRKQ